MRKPSRGLDLSKIIIPHLRGFLQFYFVFWIFISFVAAAKFEYLIEIFKKCRFEKFLTAHLDVDGKFDVSINGANKATTRGQGYRAYINTILALAFRKYLKDHGKYYPGIFSVDSPLQTLKQGVNDEAPESMKTALFRYLLETQDYGQVIVIENEIPDLDYESHGVTPICFTGGKSPGRYGFLKLEGQY